MSTYYFVAMCISLISMLGMLVCVSSSATLSRRKKKYFRLLFVSIMVSFFVSGLEHIYREWEVPHKCFTFL